jgi:hypothetical protein
MATNTTPSAAEDPHVAVDPLNTPHISFPEGTDVGYVEWLGGSFSEIEILGSGIDPVIAVDDYGAKYIVWEDDYSVDTGSGWSAPQVYVAGSDLPDVVGGSDRVHVVYRNGTTAYYVAIIAGGSPPPQDTTLTITIPNGGETWQIGSVHNITWNTSGSVDYVDIGYSLDGGSTWTDIALGFQKIFAASGSRILLMEILLI